MKATGDIFDAIIVGGGPAGASLSIRLAATGVRVLLAEQERFPRHKLCGEFISPECLAHFARLGVLADMRDARGAEIAETVFYAQGGRGVSVPSAWFGGAGAAVGLSRAEMDARLLEGARRAGVEVMEGATLSSVIFEDESVRGVRLSFAGGATREVRAPLTIDATGRRRAVARKAEAARSDRFKGYWSKDDDGVRAPLVAFKAHLSGARPRAGVCEIYFYRGGYGGLSEIEDGLFNLCFIVRAEDVRACASDAERVVNEVLMRNRRAAFTLEGARAETRWLGVALRGFGRNKPSPMRGLLAVGDAAAFIDPFTGSGMLMALESAEVAAHVINDWLPSARAGGQSSFDHLARCYETLYDARFGARLRICRLLRRAAFAPLALAEVAVRALAASEHLRRQLARATRTQSRPRTGTAHDY